MGSFTFTERYRLLGKASGPGGRTRYVLASGGTQRSRGPGKYPPSRMAFETSASEGSLGLWGIPNVSNAIGGPSSDEAFPAGLPTLAQTAGGVAGDFQLQAAGNARKAAQGVSRPTMRKHRLADMAAKPPPCLVLDSDSSSSADISRHLGGKTPHSYLRRVARRGNGGTL